MAEERLARGAPWNLPTEGSPGWLPKPPNAPTWLLPKSAKWLPSNPPTGLRPEGGRTSSEPTDTAAKTAAGSRDEITSDPTSHMTETPAVTSASSTPRRRDVRRRSG